MSVWFEGTQTIATDLDAITADVADYGAHCSSIVARIPGITSVELGEVTDDALTLTTNEGVMTRSGITRERTGDTLTLEFDEVYEAGNNVTASSHFRHAYSSTDDGVEHHLVISDVTAPGVLGALYRRFASKSMGKAFLAAHREHFEGADA